MLYALVICALFRSLRGTSAGSGIGSDMMKVSTANDGGNRAEDAVGQNVNTARWRLCYSDPSKAKRRSDRVPEASSLQRPNGGR